MDAMTMNQYGTYGEAAGALIGAFGQIEAGRAAQRSAKFQAEQLRQNAGQALASAQRSAAEVDKQAQYILSAALANAAASGGGVSDPTVVNLIARNASEFAYRKAVALYQGEERARSFEMGAEAKEFEGDSAARNANMAAVSGAFGASSSLLKGYARDSSMRQRFGGDGPKVKLMADE